MEKFLEVGLSESGLLLHEISIWNIRFSAYPIHEELPAVYGGCAVRGDVEGGYVGRATPRGDIGRGTPLWEKPVFWEFNPDPPADTL
jgi:hypothetical protein